MGFVMTLTRFCIRTAFLVLIVAGPPGCSDQLLFAQQGQLKPSPMDSVRVYFASNPSVSTPITDTLPGLEFRMYDPARKSPIDAAHLGNLGSSARPLWFQPASTLGFKSGYQPFELYKVNPGDLAFHKQRRTYSDAFFTRGGSQRDAMSFIKLSRTFSKGLNVSLHYQTINNLGQYRFQRTKHGSLAVGAWWPVRKNYDVFLVFASNTFRQQDNGGILETDFTGPGYNGPISVPILLSNNDAKTVQAFRDFQLNQYLNALQLGNNVVKASHQFNYKTEQWKFNDKNNANVDQTKEELFYGQLLTDRRGLRNAFSIQRFENHLQLSTLRQRKNQGEAASIAVGLRHALIHLQPEFQLDSFLNNVFATGSLRVNLVERILLHATGDLGLLSSAGEYRLDSKLGLSLGKAGMLEGRLLSQRRPVDWVFAELYSTGRLVWENAFEKPIESSLQVSYSLPLLGFKATASSHLVNNYLFFNQEQTPSQATSAVSVNQLLLEQRLKWGILRSENAFGLQQNNSTDILRLPSWFSKNSLYVAGNLFKKQLLLNVGVDFRINGAFTPDAYQPFLGQFQLQDDQQQAVYPWLDAFVTAKIQSFRFFLRFENMAPLWNPAENLFLTAQHPQHRNGIRLGISWRFLDANIPEESSGASPGGAPTGPPGGFRQ